MENLARPSGYDDAMYRTLALLVRQLHARSLIDAPDLIREMHLLTDRLVEDKDDQDCIDGIQGIAQSFERELQGWNEARVVHGLYMDQPDR